MPFCPIITRAGNRFLGLACLLFLSQCAPPGNDYVLPDGFVLISDVDPSIQLDIRYASSNNFLGRPVAGYHSEACILTEQAATGLAAVQQRAGELGYSLKVYDCYRPQHAVDDFVNWSQDVDDQRMKDSFYPSVPKHALFEQGYIAERSGHSRGSTIDLTLVPEGTVQPQADALTRIYDCREGVTRRYPDNSLDMGTAYDCFDALSHTDNPAVNAEVLRNRHLLRDLMEAAGFENYTREWWHYTLREEPFPDQFFDFPLPP